MVHGFFPENPLLSGFPLLTPFEHSKKLAINSTPSEKLYTPKRKVLFVAQEQFYTAQFWFLRDHLPDANFRAAHNILKLATFTKT